MEPTYNDVDLAAAMLVARRSMPYFLGLFVSWTLHGASVVLLPNYLFQFRRNPLRERLFITALVALNTVDVGFDLSRVIKVYVIHFGDPHFLVSIHEYFESSLLYFSPVFIILLCQMYFVRRSILFLRSAGGMLEDWRIVVGGVLGLAVGGSAACGFVSQYVFFGFPNYVIAVAEVSKSTGHVYNITHILWMLLGLLGMAGITAVLTVELSRTRAWQHRTTQAPRDGKHDARRDRIYVALRNGTPVLMISFVSFVLYLTQNKAWTFATGSLLPRTYSIAVIVWTALPRPRKGAPSHSSLDAPDLTWTTSEAGSTGVVNGVGGSGAGGHSPARMWTMLARPTALPGARGLRKKASFLRRGGRAEAAEPRQWVVDLEADHDQVEKIDFSSAADDDVRLGQASARARLGDDGADQAESIELQQWRESIVLGKARTSFSSASPAAPTHLTTVRQRSSVTADSKAALAPDTASTRRESAAVQAPPTALGLDWSGDGDDGVAGKDK